MKEIDLLRTSIAIFITFGATIGTLVAVYFKTINALEHRLRDKVEEQNKQLAEVKLEIEKLKNKDELQQIIINQLEKHLLGNLPAFYEVLSKKDSKK